MAAFAAAAAAGLGLSLGIGWVGAKVALRGARRERRRQAISVRTDVARIATEAAERAERELARLDDEATKEIDRQQTELRDYEADLDERDSLVESRDKQAADIATRLATRREAVTQIGEKSGALDRQLEGINQAFLVALEGRAETTRTDAIASRVTDRVAKRRLQIKMELRRNEELINQNAIIDGRRIMAVAVDRYNGVGHLERIQNIISVPDRPTLMNLGDPQGATQRAFVDVIGCELLCDEEAGTLTIRGDDPLAREISRRVLRQLANRSISSPDKVRNIALHVTGEVEREVHNAARKAVRVLSVGKLHPEILHLVGRLKFRLSYSQNQWKHAIEVGYLAGMMASEMGLDVVLARRGGLLHDIGKALTHDHDGSHAVLGAEVARRCGEDEIVSNAIGSHHNDEPPESAIAHIVTAADAMSGARPGARRENAASYMGRIKDIQRIASQFDAVERVDIMHAGREVRVLVESDERGDAVDGERDTHRSRKQITDDMLYPLAQDIARALEEEITFAGQIRVTVIRESRSVAMAW